MMHRVRRIPILFLALATPGLLLAFLFSNLQPAQADAVNIYRVAKTGDGTDGLSWSTAFTDVQDALGVAISGDEIWVATGVYTPGAATNDTFQLLDDVGIYGGFAATETERTQRDWEANPTVLSGDIGGDDTTDANGVVINPADISGDNSHSVVTGIGIASGAVLDGFIITAGQANGSVYVANSICGGGMFNLFSSPTLANLIFSGNLADNSEQADDPYWGGGGMFNHESSPTLTKVSFSNNWTDGSGGGMFNVQNSNPTLTDVTFSGNSTDMYGGGMLNNIQSSPTLTNVTFSSNWAEWGGGMFNYESSPTLTDVTFSGNWAEYGGGIYNNESSSPVLMEVEFSGNWADYGGGIRNVNNSDPSMINTTFSGNSADHDGGGMYNTDSNPVLTNVTFSSNWADYGGGMRNTLNSDPTLINVSFSGNSANQDGGGMYNTDSSPVLTNATFSGNSANDAGGGMYNWDSSPTLTNVTLSGNRSVNNGGGIYNRTSSPILYNSILWDNQDRNGVGELSTNIFNFTSTTTLFHSLLQKSGGSGGWKGDTSYIDGGNNIDEDPLFITPVNPVAAPTTAGELQLSHGSPAIDAGDNQYVVGIPFDLDGNPRVIHGVVDMGAYETYAKIRVAKTGDGSNGLSWTTAYTNVQDALSAAINVDEIWVATGVYTPGETVYDTFQLLDNVTLYGGFAATETLRPQRDWVVNPTVLSGDLAGDDDTDLNGVVTDTTKINGDNSCHVVTGSGVSNTAVLDGFIITAGQAAVAHWACWEFEGGGMYNNYGSPTLINVTFSGNATYLSGAGMYNYHSSPMLTNVTFFGNSNGSSGGGMYNSDSSNPLLIDVIFSENRSGSGGGMFNTDSYPTLTRVTFSGNSAFFGDGGGMYNLSSSPTLTDVTFSGNSTNDSGGGMVNHSSNPSLNHVSFSGNSAGDNGGGMDNVESSPSLTDVSFTDNSAHYGGGMYNYPNSSPTLTEVTFSGNSADSRGGGMGNYDNSNPTLTEVIFASNWVTDSAFANGGGMYNHESSPQLEDVTFIGNWAEIRGGGMYISGGSPIIVGATFSSNWADEGGGMYNGGSSPTLTKVNFTGNWATSDGGGMYNSTAGIKLTDVTFSANSASLEGGGMYNTESISVTMKDVTFTGNSAGTNGGGLSNINSCSTLVKAIFSGNWAETGGGMYNRYCSPTLTNASFSGNSADYGGGMYNDSSNPPLTNVTISGNSAAVEGGGMYNYYCEAEVRNSIIWNNQDSSGIGTISANIFNVSWSTALFHSLLQGSGGSSSWIGGTYYDGGNNIDVDPLFIDAVDPTTAPTTVGDLRLLYGSPAIDAGDNQYVVGVLSDLDGSPRIINGTVDMGAYEKEPAASATVGPTMGGTLTYTNSQGNTTIIQIPAGAVTEITTLVYWPIDPGTSPSGFVFAGHAFDLDAYRDDVLVPGLAFELPVSVTINYSDTDIGSLNENTLLLENWNDDLGEWEDAACGSYDRHPEDNWLAVAICHLSQFALFGNHSLYMPILINNP